MKSKLNNVVKVFSFVVEYAQDLWMFLRYNGHSPLEERSRRLSHKTIIEAHTIEKGLTLSNPKPHFGRDKIAAMLDTNAHWSPPKNELSRSMLVGALDEYQRTFANMPAPDADLADRVSRFVAGHDAQLGVGGIRHGMRNSGENATATTFLKSRFAAREFSGPPLNDKELKAVIELAQRAPSQCNRQSTRLHIYRNREKVQELLALQSGARGFADEVPVLFVVSSEVTAWGGSQQRNQLYVDGGLYSMMLMLGLDAKGFLSCPLNLAVTNRKERAIKAAGNIPARERLIMMIASGRQPSHAIKAANSPRWSVDAVSVFHN